MTRICGWCGKFMGTNGIGRPEDVTHGICEDCQKMIRKEMEELTGKPRLEPLDTYSLLEQ
ncbi:MAG: hypothetical protein ACFE9A_19070 [Candidatus Hodarchaeota archaeon]